VGLVGGADGDVEEVTGFEADCYTIQFVVDGTFENEEQLVTVGVQVARIGRAGFETDVAECQFGARGEAAVGKPLDGSPVGTLGDALAKVDDARFGGRGGGICHGKSLGRMVRAGARYPAEGWR